MTLSITVGIPAYNRPAELSALLESVHTQEQTPQEVLVCEDNSPQRAEISAVVRQWESKLGTRGCALTYKENPSNLGYDGNIRKLVESASSDWTLLMGNDDLLLPNCISDVRARLARDEPDPAPMYSRSFLRFREQVQNQLGVSRFASSDTRWSRANAAPGILVRSCGFFGGLLVNRNWARSVSTTRFDGGLYYQIYLAAQAYCTSGIGYISNPIIAGRSGNPPMFGASSRDGEVHIPGSYTPAGRARMWASILDIADQVGREHSVDLVKGIKQELAGYQSFHVFEMMAASPRSSLDQLRSELRRLDLFSQPLPQLLYFLNVALGRRAIPLYQLARWLIQR